MTDPDEATDTATDDNDDSATAADSDRAETTGSSDDNGAEATSSEEFNPLSQIIALREGFATEFDETEMDLYEPRLGHHTLYDPDAVDPTIGWKTVVYGTLHHAMEEVALDADAVEINQGAVTPDAAREQLKHQLSEHINWHELEQQMLDDVADHVASKQQRNQTE